MNLGQYRRALDAILAATIPGIAGIIRALWSPDQSADEVRARAKPLLLREVRAARRQAHAVAQEFLQSQASDAGVDDPYIPPNPGYPDVALDEILREELRGSTDEAAARVTASLQRHVEAAARQTVVRSAEDPDDVVDNSDITRRDRDYARDDLSPILVGLEEFEPTQEQLARDARIREEIGTRRASGGKRPQRAVAWARVLTGADNCAFCVMLASRGPVYSDASEAGQIRADEVWPDAKGYANSYHDGCDCVAVPVYSSRNWTGREQHARLESLWNDAQEWAESETGARPSNRDALNALDRYLRHLEREGEDLGITNIRDAA